jgi:hypothetical protein
MPAEIGNLYLGRFQANTDIPAALAEMFQAATLPTMQGMSALMKPAQTSSAGMPLAPIQSKSAVRPKQKIAP